ncbi:hypothetical protein NPIL_525381 [Nephila pilipes]|uniref:Uncharacterized protein n=1 Tax=Nephila pilipes TaxID=299642 RepID=A0A8X6TMG3_NEPPI|nr:hypothetical protein NPIL_525381 [Nephila pilipes]
MSELFEFRIENSTRGSSWIPWPPFLKDHSILFTVQSPNRCVFVIGRDGVHCRADELSCTSVSALLLFFSGHPSPLCLGDGLISLELAMVPVMYHTVIVFLGNGIDCFG